MKIKTQKPMWAQTGHRRPISRRELLAAGALPFSASLLVPDWFKLLLPQAHASQVCPSAGSGLIPMITVNLAGGAAMAANFVPMDAGGQPLPSYSLMGMGDGALPLENEFGSVKFAGLDGNGNLISKFLQGLRETAPTALVNTAFIGVCVRSRDDSAENRFAIDGMVSKAGLAGSLLPNLGRQMTFTGVSQKSAVVSSSLPLVVNNFTAITGSLGYAAALGTSINAEQKGALSKMISRLSESQSRRIAKDSTGVQVKKLVDCANIKNVELSSLSSTGVDPRTDAKGAELSAAWGINGGTGAGDQRLIFAAMAYNVLKGNAGSAGLEIGGYDYHNNTRTTGDQKDLEAGQTIGRILESAAIMGKKAFVYVTSDGAVTSADSTARNSPWTSDRGIAGASYILYYDPAGRRPTSDNQIGYFTTGQAADDRFLTGGTPELAAVAVFANYLQLNGKMNLYAPIVGRTLAESELSKVLRF